MSIDVSSFNLYFYNQGILKKALSLVKSPIIQLKVNKKSESISSPSKYR